MNSSPVYTLPSFAKINWRLQVLGKRRDGYHELRTILQTISLHDILHFNLTDDHKITVECDDPTIPTDRSNLIIRAALALKNRYDVNAGIHIRLEKRIPSRAGLGGGSSNAAVSLLALAHLWNIKVDQQSLVQIAGELGADVPFFLVGGMALGEGVGTLLSPLSDLEPQPLIVVSPTATVSTADAYRALNCGALTTLEADSILSSSPSGKFFSDLKLASLLDDLSNDFESVIFDMEPEIRRAKEAMIAAGARETLLAGSGSSVFGLFPDQQAQQIAIQKIKLEAGWRVFSCVTLSRNEYIRALGVDEKISRLRFSNFDSDIGA